MAQVRSGVRSVSRQTLLRLPVYLDFLKRLPAGDARISAPKLAAALGLNEVQVRKDLAAVSSCAGKPKTGFEVARLVRDIEAFLGYDSVNEAVLVGAGKLGRALLGYEGFALFGIRLVAAFDREADETAPYIRGAPKILPVSKLTDLCRRMGVHIGIITVPAESAQEVCDMLVEGGVRAIWNFAPVRLRVPDGVLLQNENIASSLAVLSAHLKQSLQASMQIR